MTFQSIEKVLIVGAGWVGRQVAARFARYDIQVVLVDRSEETVADAIDWIKRVEQAAAITDNVALDAKSTSPQASNPADSGSARKACKPNWCENISTGPDLAEIGAKNDGGAFTEGTVFEGVQLVLECVPESLSLKKRVLRQVSQLFPAPTVIASNSSYFVPSLLSPFVAAPSRFAHFHFHVPVLHDSIADIVGCEQTENETLAQLEDLAQRVGISPLRLRNEHPGYVFNWMLQSLLKSALELAAQDVVDIEDIDRSWIAVTGMPLGPFGMMDQIGLDVIEQVLANARWADKTGVSDGQLLSLIQAKTAAGHLGKKSKQGFYSYQDDSTLH